MIGYMNGYKLRGQSQDQKMKGRGLASEFQETTIKSGGREGLARAHRNLYSILPQDKREGARVVVMTLSGWTPAIGACDDTARVPFALGLTQQTMGSVRSHHVIAGPVS